MAERISASMPRGGSSSANAPSSHCSNRCRIFSRLTPAITFFSTPPPKGEARRTGAAGPGRRRAAQTAHRDRRPAACGADAGGGRAESHRHLESFRTAPVTDPADAPSLSADKPTESPRWWHAEECPALPRDLPFDHSRVADRPVRVETWPRGHFRRWRLLADPLLPPAFLPFPAGWSARHACQELVERLPVSDCLPRLLDQHGRDLRWQVSRNLQPLGKILIVETERLIRFDGPSPRAAAVGTLAHPTRRHV